MNVFTGRFFLLSPRRGIALFCFCALTACMAANSQATETAFRRALERRAAGAAATAAVGLAVQAARYATTANATQAPGDSDGAGGGSAGCAGQFAHGLAPAFHDAAHNRATQMLCFSQFAVLYSGLTRTPLWSAEYLTPQRIAAAHGLRRVNRFHTEDRLPASMRAELSDYVRSGYDRGHMSASGDMGTAQAQYESFSLANMVPQEPHNNRVTWEGIESAVRRYAQYNPVYVVTGPVFSGARIGFLKGRVGVPTLLFKLVYDPQRRAGGAYLVKNTADTDIRYLSVAALEQLTGLDFGLGPVAMLRLPAPEHSPYSVSSAGR